MNKAVLDILNSFQVINLSDMEEVSLMSRVDTKFVFHQNQLAEILSDLSLYYDLLMIESNPILDYETNYYDTTNFDLYLDHQRGKLNRYKFRFRNYLISNTSFFEIKFKNNKGTTQKTRKEVLEGAINQLDLDLDAFVHETTPFSMRDLEEKLTVKYSRITLVDKNRQERITIDLGLEFSNIDQKMKIDQIVVAELKQQKLKSSLFIDVMKKRHIRNGSISKYCQAVNHLYPHLKSNNFKFFSLKLLKLS